MSVRLAAKVRSVWLVCALSLVASSASAIDVPPLVHRVSDHAQLLSQVEAARLEAMLETYEKRTGRQFTLLTVPTLQDEPIDMFGVRVAEAWKLGRKGQDDGLILILVTHDHRSRIEVGYGLEADITDALTSRVLRQVIRPAFRAEHYADGIEQAFVVLMQAADKSPVEGLLPEDDGGMDEKAKIQLGFWVLLVFVILLLVGPRAGFDLLLMMLSTMGRDDDRGGRSGGGGFSGGGGGFGGGGASGDW